MATRRRPRLGRTGRVASAAVRRRFAPDVLRFARAWELAVGAQYRALLRRFAPQIELLVRQQFGLRHDISLDDLLREMSRSGGFSTELLRRLFGQVESETERKLRARLPGVALPELLRGGPRLQEAWVRQNVDLIKVPDRIKSVLERELADPLEAGVRVEELLAHLQEQFGFDARRAELIARDQTLKLSGQLQEERQTQAGIRRYVWTTSGDERVREDHADLDGRVFSWDDPPITNASEVARGRPARRGHPGSDFQCLPGNAQIGFTSPVNRAFRRWYRGQLTQLIADSGETLECTPNHPVLTSAGWQPAERVQIGQHVFKVRHDSSELFEADIQHSEASIADIFEALQLVFGLRWERGVAAQFHGDGAVDEQVEIVDVQGELRVDIEAALAQHLRKLHLANADAAAFGLSQADLVLDRLGLAAAGSVGSLRLGLAQLLWRLRETHDVRARTPAWLHSLPFEEGFDACAGDPVALSQRLDRGACDVRLHAFIVREWLRVESRSVGRASVAAASADRLAEVVLSAAEGERDFAPGTALIAKPLRVVQKLGRVFEGHVYNISTESNWYVAGTLIMHNCRCNADPIVDDLDDLPAATAPEPALSPREPEVAFPDV